MTVTILVSTMQDNGRAGMMDEGRVSRVLLTC